MLVSLVCLLALGSLVRCTEGFVSHRVHPLFGNQYLSKRASQTTSSSTDVSVPKTLEPKQLDFCLGYLNKHHSETLKKFAEAFSPIGSEMAKANVWSGGSYKIANATITNINTQQATLEVTVDRRNKPLSTQSVEFDLDTHPVGERQRMYAAHPPVPKDNGNRVPMDDIIRKLCRLCWIVKDPSVTGKLIQLGIQLNDGDGGAKIGFLPENMYLNQVPHNRFVRQFFYDKVATAVHDAVVLCSEGRLKNRMRVTSQFPEMNPSMDSYRIGTLLEMVRAVAIRLAEENIRVRVCVQASMGVGIFTGMPKQLNGVSKLLQMMDWQSEEGETNEGMVGDFVRFGAIGKEHVMNTVKDANGDITQHQDDVFVLICPQSMVGTDSSIIPLLQDMVDAAGDRPIILINDDLSDKMSAAGQQGIRGRGERMAFADSFDTVYHFQNIYVSGTSYFPILGAMTKMHPTEPWVAHQRRDYANTDAGEIYVPVLAGEFQPDGQSILDCFAR